MTYCSKIELINNNFSVNDFRFLSKDQNLIHLSKVDKVWMDFTLYEVRHRHLMELLDQIKNAYFYVKNAKGETFCYYQGEVPMKINLDGITSV